MASSLFFSSEVTRQLAHLNAAINISYYPFLPCQDKIYINSNNIFIAFVMLCYTLYLFIVSCVQNVKCFIGFVAGTMSRSSSWHSCVSQRSHIQFLTRGCFVSIDSLYVLMLPGTCCEYDNFMWVTNALFYVVCSRRMYFAIFFPLYDQNALCIA